MNWKSLYDNELIATKDGFCSKYEILSNMTRIDGNLKLKLPYGDENGLEYCSDTVEVLYQAAKSKNPNTIARIVFKNNPYWAKNQSRNILVRNDWHLIKEEIMLNLLKQKYVNSKEFREVLDNIPEEQYIVEINDWGDVYWGVDKKSMRGKNVLGNMIMMIKDGTND